MFPPPTTMPICTPSVRTSASSVAVARIISPSIPKPPSLPHSASPLSLSTMRRYFRAGSGGGGAMVSSSRSSAGSIGSFAALLSLDRPRNGRHASFELFDQLFCPMRAREQRGHTKLPLGKRGPGFVLRPRVEVKPCSQPSHVHPLVFVAGRCKLF